MKKTIISYTSVPPSAASGSTRTTREDHIAEEVPLEIVLQYGKYPQRHTLPLAVSMRTPGHDEDLAAGFLFSEGIVANAAALEHIRILSENRLLVQLHPSVVFDAQQLSRHVFAASGCGVCGKASLEAIHTITCYFAQKGTPKVTPALLGALPDTLRAAQSGFDTTGGLHAAGLFDAAGQLLLLREDVGRHNAVDKVLGAALRANMPLPLSNCLMVVSGRAGFELVQKATMAGIPLLAAIGAPTSLAVDMADASGMTLVGFLRENRFNVYTDFDRIFSV